MVTDLISCMKERAEESEGIVQAVRQTSATRQKAGKTGAKAAIRVYVASPLGFACSTRPFMERDLIPAIEDAGVEAVNPWDLPPDPLVEMLQKEVDSAQDLPRRKKAWDKLVVAIGARNAEHIASADGVVAVLDGVDVDSGTAAEIGYAAALGKWMIGYRGDFRRTGEDPAATVNLQVEYFIRKNGGTIVRNLADLKTQLKQMAVAHARRLTGTQK
jgi:nucleoside 2-deoxyribosyltransferase